MKSYHIKKMLRGAFLIAVAAIISTAFAVQTYATTDGEAPDYADYTNVASQVVFETVPVATPAPTAAPTAAPVVTVPTITAASVATEAPSLTSPVTGENGTRELLVFLLLSMAAGVGIYALCYTLYQDQ